MRHGRRWASCAAGVLLVGLATLLSSGGKESRAQPGVLDAGEKKAESLPLPPDDLAFPVAEKPKQPVLAAEPAVPEDPEQAAETFVDQTRQQAEGRIKALTAEADQLRARLKKVEAALQRWQGLRAALDVKPGPGAGANVPPPALSGRVPPPFPGPTALEPAPAATPIAPPPGAAVESEPALTLPAPK